MMTVDTIKYFLARKKDTAAIDWNQVYDDLLPRVYNFFRYRFQENQLAEDLTAVTLIRAWESRERYQADLARFSTWVMGIARHVAADEWRRQQVNWVPLEQVEEISREDLVETAVEQRQHLAELEIHLQQLKPVEQELIALKYGAGLNNRAIASLMDLSESNVGTSLHRVVKKLRVQMEVDR